MRSQLDSPAATLALGERLGRAAAAGDLIGMIGDLGAGKTLLVQGIAAGLALPEAVKVTSPTFTLINEYRGGRMPLYHCDLYRIERERELQ
ncbi:MAG TPA: tRNA (adenosine(37)-N6)-threonylcarbamoyltransferase complex ATPase subunit type 1 TsaE, partial [Kofleriaceae bacterium]|nr:tRNA (adenosine(37)-N6)-threonylcarbamoyltransferase complex ATPase subunit type 1 TsaE [Kofleriaceae bacterium]